MRVRDALTGHTTRFTISVNVAASDNPMQSEMTGHIGSKGNYFCRKCFVGGNQADKREDDGFHAMFSVCCIHCSLSIDVDIWNSVRNVEPRRTC